MFEARKSAAVPRKDRVEASARTGRPGVPEDRIRPRWPWVLIVLVAVLSAGLETAIVTNPRGRIARGKAPGPAPSRAPGVVPPAGAVDLASGLAAPHDPGGPKPEEGKPGAGAGEFKDARPADDTPHPPVAGPAGPPRPVEDATRTAADPVALGRELFSRTWLPNDPRCHGGDGLGPVYNATSCVDCHRQGGAGGGGPADRNVELATGIGYMVFGDTSVIVDRSGNGWRAGFDQEADPADLANVHPGFRDAKSAVLHRFGVDPDYSRWRSTFLGRCRMAPHVPTRSIGRSGRQHSTARARSRDDEPARHPIPPARSGRALDRALVATVRDVEAGLGMNRVAFVLTARNTPPLFGAGLIDGLSESELEQSERAQPDETRGRVHRLKDGRLGRFGWKGQVASLEEFVLTACANELGLEVPGHHQAVSPLAPDAQAERPDLTAEECAALVDYVRSLAPPISLDPSDAQAAADVAAGRRLFRSIGCASCHTADLGSIQGIYSDLLLHDMGSELSDSGAYYADESDSPGVATRSEWRTPPLWGFRDTAPYLHNGRARNLKEAVALHHGQGAASATRFRSMSDLERSRVETFLNSLVAPGAAVAPHRAR
jgi:mono/diheme cytochrome c family protein